LQAAILYVASSADICPLAILLHARSATITDAMLRNCPPPPRRPSRKEIEEERLKAIMERNAALMAAAK
jgi:hypothetical protein